MNVPVFNLSRAEQRIAKDLDRRWSDLRDRTAFVGGSEVAEFEAAWAQFLDPQGNTGCVGVANGTDALELALRAFDIGPGDEVLVPDFTFVATASAVALVGATPVLVDVDPATLNLDFDAAESLVSERTVGYIGVHLYGSPYDLDRGAEFAKRHGLWVLEDAAQAHGASWQERNVGTFGDLATWSFYPSKNLGCFGDGGAVTGPREDLLDKVRRLADHGRQEHYWHDRVGRNSRLDGLQAAVLNARLPLLNKDNDRRRDIASRYAAAIANRPEMRVLTQDSRGRGVFHQFVVLVDERDQAKEQLAEMGIGSAIHYPAPLHIQPLWRVRPEVVRGEYSVAVRAAKEVLCLPMFAELTEAEVEAVVAALNRLKSQAA